MLTVEQSASVDTAVAGRIVPGVACGVAPRACRLRVLCSLLLCWSVCVSSLSGGLLLDEPAVSDGGPPVSEQGRLTQQLRQQSRATGSAIQQVSGVLPEPDRKSTRLNSSHT